MMTKQHFEAVAAVLKSTKPATVEYSLFRDAPPRTAEQADYIRWQTVVTAMANRFEADNPRFKRSAFYAACGLLPEVR